MLMFFRSRLLVILFALIIMAALFAGPPWPTRT